jgi:hypothetical protein
MIFNLFLSLPLCIGMRNKIFVEDDEKEKKKIFRRAKRLKNFLFIFFSFSNLNLQSMAASPLHNAHVSGTLEIGVVLHIIGLILDIHSSVKYFYKLK